MRQKKNEIITPVISFINAAMYVTFNFGLLLTVSMVDTVAISTIGHDTQDISRDYIK